MTGAGIKDARRSCLLFSVLFVFFVNIWNTPMYSSAEVVIQDVLWTKEYDEGLDENYFGACRFVQSPCGPNNNGVCMQRERCANQGGYVYSDCQGGIGECCQFVQSCEENRTHIHVNQLVTVLQSPAEITQQCTFSFRKEPNICQVKLDFETFDSPRANEDGVCDTDRLRIRNSITVDRDFTTCGNLAGQHMYLTFGSEDKIEVSLKSYSSIYRIVATKIPCNSRKRVPDHCLQYFNAPTGTVKSFDYGGQQQNNQRYTVCVKPNELSSSVHWTPCSMGVVGSAFDIVTPSSDPFQPQHCDTDWVQVKGLPKVCEPFFELTSAWKSYELLVSFDEAEFPRLPSYDIPVDPMNCAATCVSVPPFECFCAPMGAPSGTNQTCQCVAPFLAQPDFNNVGFCLNYKQI